MRLSLLLGHFSSTKLSQALGGKQKIEKLLSRMMSQRYSHCTFTIYTPGLLRQNLTQYLHSTEAGSSTSDLPSSMYWPRSYKTLHNSKILSSRTFSISLKQSEKTADTAVQDDLASVLFTTGRPKVHQHAGCWLTFGPIGRKATGSPNLTAHYRKNLYTIFVPTP
jgi:hypothetical protein